MGVEKTKGDSLKSNLPYLVALLFSASPLKNMENRFNLRLCLLQRYYKNFPGRARVREKQRIQEKVGENVKVGAAGRSWREEKKRQESRKAKGGTALSQL